MPKSVLWLKNKGVRALFQRGSAMDLTSGEQSPVEVIRRGAEGSATSVHLGQNSLAVLYDLATELLSVREPEVIVEKMADLKMPDSGFQWHAIVALQPDTGAVLTAAPDPGLPFAAALDTDIVRQCLQSCEPVIDAEGVVATALGIESTQGVQFLVALSDEEQSYGIALGQSEGGGVMPDQLEFAQRAGRLAGGRLAAGFQMRQVRARLRRLERSEKVQSALYSIADLASSARDLDHFYSELHSIVAQLMYAENFYIALLSQDRKHFQFPYFVDVREERPPSRYEYPLEHLDRSLTGYILRRGEVLHYPNNESESGGLPNEIKPLGAACIDWLGVPLKRGNEVEGCLVVQSYSEDHRFSKTDISLLTFVAQHISTALGHRLAQEEMERKVKEATVELSEANSSLRSEVAERRRNEQVQSALFKIAKLSNSEINLRSFYASLHRIISELIYAENFFIALKSEDGETLEFPYQVDQKTSWRASRTGGKGLPEYVLKTSKPLYLSSGSDLGKRLLESGEIVTEGAKAECWFGVPLICNGETVGVLAVQSYQVGMRYDEQEQALLVFVSHHVSSALERRRAADHLMQANTELEQRVRARTAELFEANRDLRGQIAERRRMESQLIHQTLHDALTGLPNRALFQQRLKRATSRSARDPSYDFAVLFLDLDRFKVINDSLGHLVGDELLIQVGKRLGHSMRANDTVSRLGGDEFAVLLEDINGIEEARAAAHRIRESLSEPFAIRDREIFTSTSVGIAVGHAGYESPDEILRDADAAMYHAKSRGRSREVFFDKSMRQKALDLLEIESELRRTIENDSMDMAFQPLINLENNGVFGFEVLARWQGSDGQPYAPSDFIPLAEETGLITKLDWSVFKGACRQLAAWREAFPDRTIHISTNFSGRHFQNPEFSSQVFDILKEHDIRPNLIAIEVTERLLLEGLEPVHDNLRKLSSGGARVYLDDFGTGYSSLSYLHQFPIDCIKIDRAFVGQLGAPGGSSEAIVNTIVGLANSLGLGIIAEGIENPDQAAFLRELGCQLGQGYHLAKPLSAEAATRFLKKN